MRFVDDFKDGPLAAFVLRWFLLLGKFELTFKEGQIDTTSLPE